MTAGREDPGAVPSPVLRRWTRRFAATFESADPRGALARAGVKLRVQARPLRRGGREIHGAWDPLLRRIELFGCAARSDAELVADLGHEIWHMMAEARRRAGRGRARPPGRTPADEAAAARFARAWLKRLGAAGVRQCAAALRAEAGRSGPRAPAGKRRPPGLRSAGS